GGVAPDAVSGYETWQHGPQDVLDVLKERELEWRWWDNPAIARPGVSIVAVQPGDRLEPARPDQALTLRVRCAWENTTQGLPKKARAELMSLTLDGHAVEATLVAP